MGLEKPPDLIRQPTTPQIRAAGFFAAHAVSHQRVGSKPRDLSHSSWTQHGTEDFLVRYKRKGQDL